MVLGSLLTAFLAATGAEAGPHRARLARDLAERLAAGSNDAGLVIVEGDRAKVERLAARYGLRVRQHLAHGAVVELNGGQLDALSQDAEVDHLSSDLPVRSSMAVTTAATGADQVWRGLDGLRGFTGRGVGVAVIDSGIGDHPALRNRVVARVDFTNANSPRVDEYGHGTHVAGIIAGYEESAGFVGMAPEAHLIDLKVLGPDGAGWTSDIITAVDWAVEHRSQYAIRAINLSLGHPVVESYRDDPLCQAVERAVRAGIVVVASAGNRGQDQTGLPVFASIESPGNSPWAVTVGATDTLGTLDSGDDVLAPWSSRGLAPIDGLLKPELAAPGRQIVSLAVHGSALWDEFPERQVFVGSGPGAYQRLSGTSMAAGVVTGAVALLLDAAPDTSPITARALLMRSAKAIPGVGLLGTGAGSISVEAAVDLLLRETTSVPLSAADSLRRSVHQPVHLGVRETSRRGSRPPDRFPRLGWNPLGRGALTLADIIGWGALTHADIIGWGAITSAGDIIGWGAVASSGDIVGWGTLNSSDIIGWGASADADIIGWGASVGADIIGWGAATSGSVVGSGS